MEVIKHIRGRLEGNIPNSVDVHVGQKMKLRRKVLKMSQQTLAKHIGITFQQVQKYEKGFNRIGASRLWDISQVLGVTMDYFFSDMDEKTMKQSPRFLNNEHQDEFWQSIETATKLYDPMQTKEALGLVGAYYRIYNRKVAQIIFDLLQILAHKEKDDDIER